MLVISLGRWMLWRKREQPELLYEQEERPNRKWVLLSLEIWGPVPAQRGRWALATLSAVVAGRGNGCAQAAGAVNVHSGQPWALGTRPLLLPSRSCLPSSQASESQTSSPGQRAGWVPQGILKEGGPNCPSFPTGHSLAIFIQPRGVHTPGSHPGAHLPPRVAGR